MLRGLTLASVLLLTACAGRIPECKPGEGAGCKSVTEVNDMVINGELVGKTAIDKQLTIKPYSCEKAQKVKRLPEKTARVWMSGFEDEVGDYIEETYVYTILEGGKWCSAD